MHCKPSGKRVIMIGLDAAEPALIEEWIHGGWLPNLKRLRDRGAYGRLRSTADLLAGSPWPSFYTGTLPSDHGFYHYLQWRPDEMQMGRPSPEWLPSKPFWRNFGEDGPYAVAVDVPLAYAPEPFHGVELSGWATHDALGPVTAYPGSTITWVTREFGKGRRTDEVFRPVDPAGLLQLRDELVSTTVDLAELAAAFMEREPWDLFLVCFAAPHRGGHKLWDSTGTVGRGAENEQDQLADALREVYIACDAAIGRLTEQAGADVATIVFSLHGMEHNTCRADLLPEMLKRVLAGQGDQIGGPPAGVAEWLRGAIPAEWRHECKRRLPVFLQDKLTAFWRMRGVDWSTTRATSLIADLQGYVRINLRGREREGTVSPGAEYERLCEEITEGLSTFVDADTAEPVVKCVIRPGQVYPEGVRRDYLPDLVVQWNDSPVARQRAIISTRYGLIGRQTPGRNGDGRSGNHRAEGFVIIADDCVLRDSRLADGHIIDLAPTVCSLLGVKTPSDMRGKVLVDSLARDGRRTGD